LRVLGEDKFERGDHVFVVRERRCFVTNVYIALWLNVARRSECFVRRRRRVL
jgi:hypothetical protein